MQGAIIGLSASVFSFLFVGLFLEPSVRSLLGSIYITLDEIIGESLFSPRLWWLHGVAFAVCIIFTLVGVMISAIYIHMSPVHALLSRRE